mmetsp:Transcript_74983/g.175971  ORF Transcript_74983/g.175971 Transcript_74983/m.175971 type:complete len:196 (+) Transcript_74983:383-970(+)
MHIPFGPHASSACNSKTRQGVLHWTSARISDNRRSPGSARALSRTRSNHGACFVSQLDQLQLGIIPYAGITFFTFETLKKTVMTEFKQDELSLPQRMACGATAGLVGQSATYPLDITRRRMQTDGFLNDRKQLGIWGTMKEVAINQGIRKGLYKGLSMNWFKGPVAVGISFTTFETLKALLAKHFGIHVSHQGGH